MMNGRDSLHVELDSDETIDNFETPWWSEFHNAVDNGAASSMLNDTESIVTGMSGALTPLPPGAPAREATAAEAAATHPAVHMGERGSEGCS
jgi:hypothetical protein